jgi:hypothetical protein
LDHFGGSGDFRVVYAAETIIDTECHRKSRL